MILLLLILGAVMTLVILFANGVISFPEFETIQNQEKTDILSVDDLEEGYYYVWHNAKKKDIHEDLEGAEDLSVFKMCPEGKINWSNNEFANHTIWFTSKNDVDIPTYYPGDELLFISSDYVPYEGIEWEHFADYGYTIGVANMVGDSSGHYRIINEDGKGYEGYVFEDSDAAVLNDYLGVEELFLDKVKTSNGEILVRENNVSAGGTVAGLVKNKKYVAEWYVGTYYQDYEMKANVHAFGSIESFKTYDYEFLHSNCIAIKMPEWLKTGYYYLDNIGLFRYVTSEDAAIYSGESYDPSVNWNEPIIIYDENGQMISNPTDPDFVENTELQNGEEVSTENEGDPGETEENEVQSSDEEKNLKTDKKEKKKSDTGKKKKEA